MKNTKELNERQLKNFQELIDDNLFTNKQLIRFAKKFPNLANLIALKILEQEPNKFELAYIIKHVPTQANTAAANYLTIANSSVEYELALAFVVKHIPALAETLLTKPPGEYMTQVIKAVLHSENSKTNDFVDYVFNYVCTRAYLKLIIKKLPCFRERALDAYDRFKLTLKDRIFINKYRAKEVI